MLKVELHPDYPPEDGRYLRGNDFSPVAVAIILNCDADKIQPELVSLIRAGVECGAALSGSVQTPNIGFEKMVCNITANPNIRYLILGGPESQGHLTGDALRALVENGVDVKKRIVGTEAPNAVLYNLSIEMIERFRNQVSLIDLQFEGDPEQIGIAVRACYQENPVGFRGYRLHDPGAYPAPPLDGKLTSRVTQPWVGMAVDDEREMEARNRAIALMERLKAGAKGRRLGMNACEHG